MSTIDKHLFDYYAVVTADFEHIFDSSNVSMNNKRGNAINDLVMAESTSSPFDYDLLDDTSVNDYVVYLNSTKTRRSFFIKRSISFIPNLEIIDLLFVDLETYKLKKEEGYEAVTDLNTGTVINFSHKRKKPIYLIFQRRGNHIHKYPYPLTIVEISVDKYKNSLSYPHGYSSVSTLPSFSPPFLLYLYKDPSSSPISLLFSPYIKEYYPNDQLPLKKPCPDLIDIFLFPTGISLFLWNTPPPVTWTPFLIHTVLGTYRYGVSITLYEPLKKEQKELLLSLFPREFEGISMDEILVPKGILLVSQYPYIIEMKKVLMQLYTFYRHPSPSLPLSYYISQLIDSVPAPSLGTSVIINWTQNDLIEFLRHKSRGLPFAEIPLSPLLSTLSPPTIIDIITGILLEYKIIAYSSSPSLLFFILQAIHRLLFPFKIAGTYIPLCPPSLLFAVDVPGTCVIGTRTCDMVHCCIPDDALVIDIDHDSLYIYSSSSSSSKKMKSSLPVSLPKDIQQKISTVISQVQQYLTKEKQQSKYLSSSSSQTQYSLLFPSFPPLEVPETVSVDIYRCFLDVMSLLVGGYKNYIQKDIHIHIDGISIYTIIIMELRMYLIQNSI
ncbi:hypothetical protein WA158_002173 [Blastocystis sp. Blastoise]